MISNKIPKPWLLSTSQRERVSSPRAGQSTRCPLGDFVTVIGRAEWSLLHGGGSAHEPAGRTFLQSQSVIADIPLSQKLSQSPARQWLPVTLWAIIAVMLWSLLFWSQRQHERLAATTPLIPDQHIETLTVTNNYSNFVLNFAQHRIEIDGQQHRADRTTLTTLRDALIATQVLGPVTLNADHRDAEIDKVLEQDFGFDQAVDIILPPQPLPTIIMATSQRWH